MATKKWAGLLGPRDLDRLQVSDFQMVELGQRFNATYDCQREPQPAPVQRAEDVPMPAFALVLLGALLLWIAGRKHG